MGQIVAMGGGGWLMDDPLLDRYVLDLVPAAADRACAFIPTASGDRPASERAHDAFPAGRYETSVLRLFEREVADIEAFLCGQDLVYVGGGNTVSMLAVWRAHGVDRALRIALGRGCRHDRGQRRGELLVRCLHDGFLPARPRRSAARRSRVRRGVVHTPLRRRGGAATLAACRRSGPARCRAATRATTSLPSTSSTARCTRRSRRGAGARAYRVERAVDGVRETALDVTSLS